MKLDHQYRVIEPAIGDAELANIDFDSAGITLHIKLTQETGDLYLRLVNPHWFSFSTSFPQNVIENIILTEEIGEALEVPGFVHELLARREQAAALTKTSVHPLKIIRITPLAGPELICIADDVRQA
jgi:hypothetical protein